jgi:Tfp pilus assembly PilM family ATPase
MARSCGIRLGPRRYEIVVLDGSPKKHRITAFKSGEFDPASTDPIADFGKILKAATKELRLPQENVGLVIDSGHAAFRRLTLPFADRSKIDQVLKFEIESQLPQWSIEDVVVDYHVMAESDTSSDLLVSAVPKDDVQAALDICEKAGLEPMEAELETSAMVNAANAASICNIDDAQLLVHIGDYSTSVVVMDAAEVREMRVIHIGALTHVAHPSEAPDPEPAKQAEDEASEDSADSGLGALDQVDPIEASRRADQAIKRIRRELGRTISGARTVNPIEAVYVCGMELPGLVGSSVLDVPVYVLDCFEEDSGQPADGVGSLVIAYGAAIRELGGGLLSPSLRREELRFTGT